MVRFLVICLTSIFLATACTQVPAEMPEDFSLTLEWNTGSLPPQYTYMYIITLGPGQQGELEYRPGYDPEDDSRLWVAEFTPGETQMAALYDFLQEQDMFRSNWKKGELLLGSSGTSLILSAFGKEYAVPSISELDRDGRGRVEAAMEAIRAVVPQPLWDELEARQAAYEAEFEE